MVPGASPNSRWTGQPSASISGAFGGSRVEATQGTCVSERAPRLPAEVQPATRPWPACSGPCRQPWALLLAGPGWVGVMLPPGTRPSAGASSLASSPGCSCSVTPAVGRARVTLVRPLPPARTRVCRPVQSLPRDKLSRLGSQLDGQRPLWPDAGRTLATSPECAAGPWAAGKRSEV